MKIDYIHPVYLRDMVNKDKNSKKKNYRSESHVFGKTIYYQEQPILEINLANKLVFSHTCKKDGHLLPRQGALVANDVALLLAYHSDFTSCKKLTDYLLAVAKKEKFETFKLWEHDMWADAGGGYSSNNRYFYGEIVALPERHTPAQLFGALVDKEVLGINHKYHVDNVMDENHIYLVTTQYDNMMELELVDNELQGKLFIEDALFYRFDLKKSETDEILDHVEFKKPNF